MPMASFQLVLPIMLVLLAESVVLEATLGTSNFSVACSEEERNALLKFKQGLTDPLGQLSSWVGEECCEWMGIGCSNQTGNVIKLNLSNPFGYCYQKPCLSGELNPSLLNLTYLTYLNLRYNSQGFPIPSFIGSFKNLRYLDLSYSSFGGMIPHLGNLSRLLHLDLSSYSVNTWVSDLNWLSGLSSLQYLSLSYVNLNKSTNWLQAVNMLPSLLELHLSFCKLNVLPQSIPHLNFTSLSVIDLSNNRHFNSSLPQWPFNISSLVKLDLSGSDLTGSIPEIASGNLCSLQTLYLSDNSISGDVEGFLDALSGCSDNSLESLDLRFNELGGNLLDSLGSLKYLETLFLSYNSFSGSIPKSVSNLSYLSILDLSHNKMSGTIPESIGRLTELRRLLLWDNQWEGIVSEIHLHNLTNLEEFTLYSTSKSLAFNVGHDWIPLFSLLWVAISHCQLIPLFPSWLETQKELDTITLSNDAISSTIPEWLWTLSNVSWLDLSNNKLSGKLPQSINLAVEVIINLGSNRLEGSVPLWPNAGELFLANNKLSGPIPSNIGQEMSDLFNIDLSRNYLNGNIPPSITRMKGLSSLDLSNNYLSGNIPSQWKDLKYVLLIDLSNNNLSGGIPSSMCSQSPIEWLRLSNNNLSGELNPSLQDCAQLQTLDVGGNRLSGEIPKWIGENLTSLQFLLLGSNMFSGNFPEQLCRLPDLHILDLSQNNISGPIPNCLVNLEAMKNNGEGRFWGIEELPRDEFLILNVKGRQYEYSELLWMVNSIDLSSNILSGEIPPQMTKLSGLVAINLSRNQLTGRLPESMGSLQRLETLDLSSNHLSGPIPLSMTSMTLLSTLNLSHNNLSGPIPTTNQFNTYNDPSIFEGNSALCGSPLPTQCSLYTNGDPQVQVKQDHTSEDEDETSDKIWFYLSTSLGFVVGFWVVFGSLVMKRSWRHAYFKFVDKVKDRLILALKVKMAHLQRKIVNV